MANDMQPMISYSCLMVTLALSVIIIEILRQIFQGQGRFWPLAVVIGVQVPA